MNKEPINPKNLNPKQKEGYNFQKVSAVLADYGYMTIRLSDDWAGADFIAQHLDGSFLKVQLKGRLTFWKKYENKDLWMCFPSGSDWYIYPHDEALKLLMKRKKNSMKSTYEKEGTYGFPKMSEELKFLMNKYKISRPNQSAHTTPASAPR